MSIAPAIKNILISRLDLRLRVVGPSTELVVGDDLAGLRDVLFDGLDLVGPVAAGFVRVGNAGGILAFGLGQMIEEDVEVLLGSEAGHSVSV
jgi:hypothetical protein